MCSNTAALCLYAQTKHTLKEKFTQKWHSIIYSYYKERSGKDTRGLEKTRGRVNIFFMNYCIKVDVKHADAHLPITPAGVLRNFPLKWEMTASHFSVDSILEKQIYTFHSRFEYKTPFPSAAAAVNVETC